MCVHERKFHGHEIYDVEYRAARGNELQASGQAGPRFVRKFRDYKQAEDAGGRHAQQAKAKRLAGVQEKNEAQARENYCEAKKRAEEKSFAICLHRHIAGDVSRAVWQRVAGAETMGLGFLFPLFIFRLDAV